MSVMTPEQFAAYMKNPIEYELGRATRAGMQNAAAAVKAATQVESMRIAPRGISAGKLSKKNKIGVFYQVYGYVNAFAVVGARGPIHLIEEATKPHIIAPRIARVKGRGSKVSNRAAKASRKTGYGLGETLGRRTGLMVTGGYLKGQMPVFVRHPGTAGQHPFARGVARSEVNAVSMIEFALKKVGD